MLITSFGVTTLSIALPRYGARSYNVTTNTPNLAFRVGLEPTTTDLEGRDSIILAIGTKIVALYDASSDRYALQLYSHTNDLVISPGRVLALVF